MSADYIIVNDTVSRSRYPIPGVPMTLETGR
jgi:hypothetical protein